jgi:hypothetical protein
VWTSSRSHSISWCGHKSRVQVTAFSFG